MYEVIEGAELTSKFIEEYNKIIARELKTIKQEGMLCALQQAIATCHKVGYTMSEQFGGRNPTSFQDIYKILTDKEREKYFNEDCVGYFKNFYKIVHSIFKEDVDWVDKYLERYAEDKKICFENIRSRKQQGERLHFLCKAATSGKSEIVNEANKAIG